ncbi:Holliday junction resolvase MOC1, chloroplastic-like [Dioscorea cayenensis subsp. rotundata]|uniref:Holliday junction resolvase MOC1, chloroplastic-like n=1 Tax=Dioscorea cayennensis subsp. rotundata TaxID=55577 RepID=A0AB40BRY9_DIOCR|nr:Holliday junction resolvase MOC1, chloroplastic-like [Dioscorea cayenensis subsp. rotundata]
MNFCLLASSALKEKWLDSLSMSPLGGDEGVICASEPQWVLGVDPDVSAAVALLKPDGSVSSAQVFDTPNVKVLVGKRVRNCLDARSIVQLLQTFGVPHGTRAYIESQIPSRKMESRFLLKLISDRTQLALFGLYRDHYYSNQIDVKFCL